MIFCDDEELDLITIDDYYKYNLFRVNRSEFSLVSDVHLGSSLFFRDYFLSLTERERREMIKLSFTDEL